MDKILNAFSDIAEVLPRIDRLKATFGDINDFQHVIGLIFSDIFEFHRRAYRIFRRKSWHFWFAIDWGLFERRFKLILHNLNAHCDLMDREAAAIHFSEMKEMRDKRQREEEYSEQQRNNQIVQEVFAWLAAGDVSQEEYLNSISDKRQPETCNWILDDVQMSSWIEDDDGNAVVWMIGIPGAGKSILCSFIIESLRIRHDVTSLYFFCGQRSFNEKSSNEARCALVLRTLATQLLRQNLDIALPIYLHQEYLQKRLNCSSSTAKRVLRDILSSVKTTRIVLDGIDEYDNREQQEILRCLLDLQKITGNSCKLLISSRNEPLIDKSMPHKVKFDLKGKTVESLNLYIRHKVEDLKASNPEYEPALFVRLKDRFEQKAKGMFLWVQLVSTMLEKQISEMDFEEKIERLPDGLKEAYGQILSRFCDLACSLKERVFKILFWLCVSYRPVGLHELVDGISLKPGQTVLSSKTKSRNPSKHILEVCAPLIEISSNEKLDLVHFTAKEYVLHDQSGPFIESTKAHFSIAFSCITNLNSALNSFVPRYNEGVTEAELENRVVQGHYGLHSYAHQFWAEHLMAFLEGSYDPDDEKKGLISILEAFSKVRKYQADISSGLSLRTEFKGLRELEQYPQLLDFVSSWLQFKSKLNEKLSSLSDVHSQVEWQLQSDETYLSLIDSRLRDITEKLLMMKSSALPSHIDENDHETFIKRFRFACRSLGCDQNYKSIEAREAHELTHLTSFPCLDCDFSERGFKSRKDLERHIRKYHMSREDFEVPSSLLATDRSFERTSSSSEKSLRLGCWNEQGRKDLQQTFQQTVAQIESRLGLENSSLVPQRSRQSDSEIEASGNNPSATLVNIRDKIKDQQYQTLRSFRNDILMLSCTLDHGKIAEKHDIEAVCDQELEKTISGFPALGNFNCKSRKYKYSDVPSSERLNECKPISVDSDASSYPRQPYWSSTEEALFPRLLEKCGRNLIEMAKCLRTKTMEEINQHLMERTDLSDLANAVHARTSSESLPTCATPVTGESRPEKISISESNAIDRSVDSEFPRQILNEPDRYMYLQQDSFGIENIGLKSYDDPKTPQVNIDGSAIAKSPEKRKRRPPPRVVCPHCSTHTNELRDEYVLRKHIDRFHKPTRSAWICDDISWDKSFLAGCIPCSKGNHYKTEQDAVKHLRQAHFRHETPKEKLYRWIRETEEPNPKYKRTSINPSFINAESQGLDQKPRSKRQKISWKTDLHQNHQLLNDSNLLPAMRNSPENPETPEPQNIDEPSSEDFSSLSSKILSKDALIPDVSFDSFLPSQMTESREINIYGPPHRSTRAFIRPDQVHRLPHLDPINKTVYYDHVEALYQILDDELVGSAKYQETLKSLSSLSERLLRELRDWQRKLACAPKIPIKL